MPAGTLLHDKCGFCISLFKPAQSHPNFGESRLCTSSDSEEFIREAPSCRLRQPLAGLICKC